MKAGEVALPGLLASTYQKVMTMSDSTCPHCGLTFLPRSNGGKPQRFCSSECRLMWGSAHRWDSRILKTAPCVVCRKITASRSGIALCDDAGCRSAWAVGRRLRVRTGTTATPIAYFDCEECGRLFVGRVRTNRAFCTRQCTTVAARRTNKHRRRSAARTGDRITILRLAERDGWICHLCRTSVRRRFGNTPTSPSIDHLIPLSKGGEHIWSNVALAHKGCNTRRWTGGEVQLRLT